LEWTKLYLHHYNFFMSPTSKKRITSALPKKQSVNIAMIFWFIVFIFLSLFAEAQCALDVFIANDQSGSVDSWEHAQSRHFITSLMMVMQPWGTGFGESRMAVAEWDNPNSWTQYSFPTAGQNYTTLASDVVSYQNSPRILYGGTDPYSALFNTYQMINQTPIPGRTANKVIILMTDAACSQVAPGIANLATQIKNEGIYIIVMAIEPGAPCPALANESVASPGGYFSSIDYASLEIPTLNLVQDLINAGCLGPPSPTFDLNISLDDFTMSNCDSGHPDYQLDFTVNNTAGAGADFNDNLLISFYNGDPKLPTSSFLKAINFGVQSILIGGSYSDIITDPILGSSSTIWAVANFDGSDLAHQPPIPAYLYGITYVDTERITYNNFSNEIFSVGDATCPPRAILHVNVNSGGLGCDDIANYEVTICNTGDADVFVSTSLPIPIPGAILLNNTTQPLNYTVNLLWASYVGGTSDDLGYKVATDPSGNVYIAGSTTSTTNISSPGAHQISKGSKSDAFLVKFNTDGVRLWGTYYGGGENDYANGVATDASGNVYMVGNTESANGIATAGAYQTSPVSSDDGFIVKFNSSGVRQWGSYYGGDETDIAVSVDTDGSGNVFMAGYTQGSTTLASAGSHQPIFGGEKDEFLVKFNSSGTRQWATYYGGEDQDIDPDVTIDPSGNVYLTGQTQSVTAMATAGSFHTTNWGDDDVFLAKFNTNGVRQWATYYGGLDQELFPCVTTDPSGNIYLGGETNSTTTIATAGSHQSTFAGATDVFLVKFSPAGTRQWGTYYGGAGTEGAKGIATDLAGNVYMAGPTTSVNGISTLGCYQPNYIASDVFITKLNPSGERQWGTYYGGTGTEMGNGLTTDAANNIFLSGYTNSTNNIATSGSHQPTYGSGLNDAFIAKFNESEIGTFLYANDCITKQYTYDLSAVAPGSYDFSFGITADTVYNGDGTPFIYPDTSFDIGMLTDLDGFNGSLHSSDDVIVSAVNTACIPTNQVTVSVSIPTTSACGNENYVSATVTINNISGLNIFDTWLHLNLTGTGVVYASEIYNITPGLTIPAPSLLDPAYPSVPNALFGQNGDIYLPMPVIPANTSTFTVDIQTGSTPANLFVQIDSIPSAFNASGQSNLAFDAQGVSVLPIPVISGFNCPASITVGNIIALNGISVTNSANVLWSSNSVSAIPNSGTLASPSISYVPTAVDIANGLVVISLTVTSSAGCETTKVCQIPINGVVYDYGDAPISFDFNTNSEPLAAASTSLNGLYLGATSPDTESIANHSNNADGDGIEEDGLLSSGCNVTPIAGQLFNLRVTATNHSAESAYLSAFIDWNDDGTFLADTERVAEII
jgi:hypothetical protein